MAFTTLLVLPPKYGVHFPPLGTPALLGFLRSRGLRASQWDLNHEYAFDRMSKVRTEGKDGPVRLDGDSLYSLYETLANDLFLKKAKSGVYYAKCLENPFKRAAYNDWTTSSYAFAENLLESGRLEEFLEDESENMFLQFFLEAGIAGRVAREAPDLLGLSVIGPSQIIPTLTLAKLLKERTDHKLKIVIGGQWPTLYFDQLAARPDLTRWLDFIVTGEGETPLLALVEALDAGRSVGEVPNLAYAQAGAWRLTGRHTKEDMSGLPTPDFDGMPLGRYLSDAGAGAYLTFETSRECYWNRCTYCVDLPMPHEGYRIKPIELLVRDILQLKSKHDCRYLEISDPAIAPKRLKDLSLALIERDARVPFWCFARLEKNFTKELFAVAAKAGLEGISFGMETASQRIMDSVDKGTSLDDCRRVIREAAEAGVKVNLQIILRLPTETFDEGLQTVKFLVENDRWISQATFNVYYLTPGNLIYQHPEKNRIRILPGQPKFRFFHEFENLDPNTMSYEQADELMALYALLRRPLQKRAYSASAAAAEPGPIAKETAGPRSWRLAPEFELVRCTLELCGETAERNIVLRPDGTPFGPLSRKDAELLRELLKDHGRAPRDESGVAALRDRLDNGMLVPAGTPQPC